MKKGLRLPADKMMPAFVTLRDYGNTSSSSTWWAALPRISLPLGRSCRGMGRERDLLAGLRVKGTHFLLFCLNLPLGDST